ncbi:MAG: hypothetical protein R6X14_10125 [bacterium]
MMRLCALVVLASGLAAAGGLSVDVEAGPVFSGYNDVRIPGDGGSDFSLVDDLDARVAAGIRGRVSYTFGDRHWASLLVAPLRVDSRGSFDREVLFAGERFSPGVELDALYRFDSYRLSYRYGLVRSGRFRLDLGLTAKVRDAEIRLCKTGVLPVEGEAKKTNTGLVPLISFRADWRLARRLGLELDGDALAVPQGRAEDVSAALRLGLSDRVDARMGYRLLEGGSDVAEVYGFALFHYAVAGLTLRL